MSSSRAFAPRSRVRARSVGITLDYAPVLDVHTNDRNAVIGDRALSSDAADVARLAGVLIRAFQAEGVAACGKHFPGHGDTSADSHFELPLVEHPLERLRAVEFRPGDAPVHHAVIHLDRTASSRQRGGADGHPGHFVAEDRVRAAAGGIEV
jgi:beta-N-acetylhexosaminidase